MNYFLDSNVILSYIFTLDNNHYSANDFLVAENYYFCSQHVNDEVAAVFKTKNSQYQLFLLKLSRHINQFNDNDLINEFSIHNVVNSFKPIGKLKLNEMHNALNMD